MIWKQCLIRYYNYPCFRDLPKKTSPVFWKRSNCTSQNISQVSFFKEGGACHELVFILKGEIASSTSSADSSYCFTEYFPAPFLIEAHSIFGMKTHYASTYRARTEVHTVSISKAFVVKELFNYEIFRLNYMNIISSRTQMLHNRLWAVCGDNLEARIAYFILSHAERLSGEKALKIKMEDLAQIVNDTRTGVSKTLNNMQAKGLVELHRGEIVIPDAKKLSENLYQLSL